MSATVHLVLGAPGADRTGRVLAAYHAATAVGFGTALVLTRTRRHADQIRARLGGRVPLLFDIRAFADELVRVHDPEGDATGADEPDATGGYLAGSKQAGVDVRELLKASPGLGSTDRHKGHLVRAAELWAGHCRRPFHRVSAVFLVGFLSLSPPERELLDALRGAVEHLWVELPEGEGEAFTGARAVREWAGEVGVVTERAGEDGPATRSASARRGTGTAEGVCAPLDLLTHGRSPRAGAARRGAFPTALHLIEAPGEAGEARLVSREVRTLLAGGVPADRVLVVPRHLDRDTADRFAEAAHQKVCVRAAEHAVGLDCDYLFLVGLGEGSWPDLSSPAARSDDPARDRLRRAGFVLSSPVFRLGAERLMFLSLAAAPRRGLFLSYPATDDHGRPLRPSAFLREFKACFPPDVIRRACPRVPAVRTV